MTRERTVFDSIPEDRLRDATLWLFRPIDQDRTYEQHLYDLEAQSIELDRSTTDPEEGQ